VFGRYFTETIAAITDLENPGLVQKFHWRGAKQGEKKGQGPTMCRPWVIPLSTGVVANASRLLGCKIRELLPKKLQSFHHSNSKTPVRPVATSSR
jgi:hypothetical protein